MDLWTCAVARWVRIAYKLIHFILTFYIRLLLPYSFNYLFISNLLSMFSLHLFIAINTCTASIGPKALRHETGNLDSGGIITSFLDLFITWDLARRFQ